MLAPDPKPSSSSLIPKKYYYPAPDPKPSSSSSIPKKYIHVYLELGGPGRDQGMCDPDPVRMFRM